MKYEVQCKNDFLTGLSLAVKIPEIEVDRNALYTIQADCPDFILPFHFKNSNGYIELVYKVGTLCKLQYFSGDLSPKEYVQLWQSLLEPLLICTDWFMNPCSFLLNTDYLYYDKNKKSVSYIYIPSTDELLGYDAFYKMAVEVSKLMTVSDATLENKVLRAIMKDFNPLEFLQMLKNYVSSEPEEKAEPVPVEPAAAEPVPEERNKPYRDEVLMVSEVNEAIIAYQSPFEDIIIDVQQEIKQEQRKKEKESGGYRIFSSKSKKKRSLPEPVSDEFIQKPEKNINISIPEPLPPVCNKAEATGETQNSSILQGTTGLRYIGRSQLPPVIKVQIKEGEVYSIGRFDAAVGKKQSNFEFDKKTKAVSRRHAVVERNVNGYNIIDLSSSAGTYVNDKKLPPNTPYGLETGFRVSFGNSGADYVWEVS